MKFTKTKIDGVWIIDLERKEDERGFFARTWCREELEQLGLDGRIAQCSISYNKRAGTLRGLHFQRAPGEEAKVVSCGRGAIYDVALDLRPTSATFRKWVATELSDDNGRMLYIGAGMAHGFQTLADDCVVQYCISTPYRPELSSGVRWNDPAFAIEWPHAARIIAERDATFADFEG